MSRHHHGDGGLQSVPAGSLVARLAQARAERQRGDGQRDSDLATEQELMADLQRLGQSWAKEAAAAPQESEPAEEAAPSGETGKRRPSIRARVARPALPDAAEAPDSSENLPAAPEASDRGEDVPEAIGEEWPVVLEALGSAEPRDEPEVPGAAEPATSALSSQTLAFVDGLARARAEIEVLQAQAERAQAELRRLAQTHGDAQHALVELQEARAELQQVQTELLETQAELHAVRRRNQRDKSELGRNVVGDVMMQIIPVLDDLDRALTHMPDGLRDDPWTEGVLMIGQSMRAMLAQQGVERIDPQGQPFDPYQHEAIAQVEADGITEDTIANVYRPGYLLNGRVLRPAQVQVATRKDK